MRTFSSRILRLVVVTAAVLCPMIFTPTAGAAAGWWLELSPSEGPPGTAVTVTGHGFPAQYCAGYATLWWAGYEAGWKEVPLALDDSDPSFRTEISVPSDVESDDLSLKSLCGTGEISEPGPSKVFKIVPELVDPYRVTAEPLSGPAGSAVKVSGSSAAACAPGVRLWWRGSAQDLTADVNKTTGVFQAELQVPADSEPGPLDLVATCLGTDMEDLTIIFSVVAAEISTSSTPSPTSESVAGTSTTVRPTSDDPGTTEQEQPQDDPADGGTKEEDEQGDPVAVGDYPHAAAAGARIHPVRMTDVLPAMGELRFSLAMVLALVGLVTMLILLVAFPAELFNKTYEKHKTEIHRILGLKGRPFPRWLGGVVFVLVSALLSAMFAGGEGAAGNPVAQVLGFLVAIPVVTFAYCLPGELLSRRRSRIHGYLELLPSALIVAVVCAGLSWLLALDPPYVYGLFAGFATIHKRKLTEPEEGGAVLSGVVSLVVFGTMAWLVWRPVHAAAYGPAPTWPAVVVDAALFWVFVLAAESLVFALVPLRFLDGETLKKWRLVSWLVPQVVAVVAFGYVLVLRGGMNPPGGGAAAVVKALAFFVVFGLLSVAFWGYFRWARRPSRHLAAALR